MQTPVFEPLHPKIVLAVAAHPDDLEFSVAGTVAKFVADGAAVYYYILTNANKGSADRSLTLDQIRDIRRDEQREACRILGVKDVFFGDYEDGLLEVTPQLKCDIVKVIRQLKPDVVLTMDPSEIYSVSIGIVNHTDHRAAGQATLDAVYPLARDYFSFKDLCDHEQLEPHNVKTLLMINFEKQNYYVDITDQMETKLEALRAHTSQLADPQAACEMVRNYAAGYGAHVGSQYAEGYMRLDLII